MPKMHRLKTILRDSARISLQSVQATFNLNWLLPNACVLCRSASKRDLALCVECEKDLPYLLNVCLSCANAFATEKTMTICGECLRAEPPFARTVALFFYQKPISHLIYQLKFNKNLVYARLLGELFARKIQAQYRNEFLPEVIVPVPLHFQRLQERGFNQAVEIARPVTKKLKIPLDLFSCQRIRATTPQAELKAEERQHNVKDAFTANTKLKGKHVAVFDDVVTTSQTVRQVCFALEKAGVSRIDVWSIAKTP